MISVECEVSGTNISGKSSWVLTFPFFFITFLIYLFTISLKTGCIHEIENEMSYVKKTQKIITSKSTSTVSFFSIRDILFANYFQLHAVIVFVYPLTNRSRWVYQNFWTIFKLSVVWQLDYVVSNHLLLPDIAFSKGTVLVWGKMGWWGMGTVDWDII